VDISVVIPVYGCRACLAELSQRLKATLSKITSSYEIILVNDACPQNSWEVIKRLALDDRHVKGIDLSRNFGQIRAITAGLNYAEGEWVVVMDCDLQDSPEEIANLYNKAQEGYDVVLSRRMARKGAILARFSSSIFSWLYGYLTGGALDSSIGNFSISRRLVMESYRRMGDKNRAFIPFIKWMGFKSTILELDQAERVSGKSSYSFRKRFLLAQEIITTQSNKPLVLSIEMGLLIAAAGFLYGIYTVLRYFLVGIRLTGWTSVIVSIYFIGGIVLVQLGIIGLYIGYVFDQTKDRPVFIVREIIEKQQLRHGG
jgi:glycosyltransferase involved in cell wall biosynthesis